MTTTRPEPWHHVVRLKEELRTGELTLAEFAADLHEVTLGRGTRPVYEDPARFFALTYPTHALRELGQGRGGAARGREHQGGAATGADLRRRQDPHPHHALPPLSRFRLPCRTSRRYRSSGNTWGRSCRRRFRYRSASTRSTWNAESTASAHRRRDAHPEASVERARVPARGSRRTARAACRRQGRGA